MQKIPSLFKRDYDGNRLVIPEVVEGCEWVLTGEGVATVKWDGTCCMVRDGRLYKRYDRKPTKAARRKGGPYLMTADFKPAPDEWEPCEPMPNKHTGHWPGWLPVGEGPEDQWHREAWDANYGFVDDGTYELIGPKVQGNLYGLQDHNLVLHGNMPIVWSGSWYIGSTAVMYDAIKHELELLQHEGIVWHHDDGRMCKIKRKDFGLAWPI